MTVESTVLRKPEAASPAVVIEFAVVSSVRREEFRERLKSRRTAWQFTVNRGLELARRCRFERTPHRMDPLGTPATPLGCLHRHLKGAVRNSP